MQALKKTISFLIFLWLSYACFSCKNETKTTEKITPKVSQDSLDILINKSFNSKIDSTEQKLLFKQILLQVNQLKIDTVKLKHLSNLSYKSIYSTDSLFFRQVNHDAIKLAEIQKDSSILGDAYWDLGLFLENTKQIDSTFFYYNKSLNIFSNLEFEDRVASLYLSLSLTQRRVSDYSGAELSVIKAMEIFKKDNDSTRLSRAYNSLGSITHSLGDHEKAVEYFVKAKSYLKTSSDNDLSRIIIENNIGVTHLYAKEYKKANNSFSKVLKFENLRTVRPQLYSKVNVNLSNAKIALNTKEDLTPIYLEAIAITKDLKNTYSEATTSGHYAKWLAYKKDTLQSKAIALKGLKLSRESENYESLLRILDFLTTVDKDNATAYAQEYFKINKKVIEDERKLRDKFARTRFQTDEFIERNELLAQKNDLLFREKRLWITMSIGGLITIIAVIIIFIQRNKNKELQFKQQQQEANQEIFNLLLKQQSKLNEGKKIEQERISQELHDGFLNKILGIRLVLLGLNKKTDPESVKQRGEIITELADLSEDIRSLSHELNYAAYQKMQNFISSIDALVKTFEMGTENIDFKFKYNSDLDWDGLKGEIKINLYRIVQESIQNCIKHAKADTIFINFDLRHNKIIVSIEDNGIGFDTKKNRKGIGFRNIKSRLKKLDGSFIVESTASKGTTLTIKIPYINEAEKTA
ncbi:hypothetical protein KO500_06430 [Cellulophaga baltica]|uniref:tetratricopeptide repeat-containing sensor histidine kinase n=1 Tax=Cellulophaga TaxID=104264 RepID=UPI001C06D335|nr:MULTISPECIES: tetratricopeptide repeat-containing sensor histidine kinase [Cellulophaga]MBU2996061.1 hypothetical protein [Cellulophaga baltica]MDO6767456.1 ATP-binding protein [Cellulophaga sp. 1_MG-2023]